MPEAELRAALRTIGTSQLDLYMGPLSPPEIAQEVLQYLEGNHLQHPVLYQEYLLATGTAYRTITLSDKTDWVLRWGVVEARHVHLHPARYSAHTMRVKANVLKTAIATVISVKKERGSSEVSTSHINKVRAEWLALPPVKDFSLSEGLHRMISLIDDAI